MFSYIVDLGQVLKLLNVKMARLKFAILLALWHAGLKKPELIFDHFYAPIYKGLTRSCLYAIVGKFYIGALNDRHQT